MLQMCCIRFGGGNSRGNIDAIAVNVVVFDNDIAKIDANSEHNGWLERFFIRHRGAGALHRKRTVHSIDYAAELDDGTIAHQLDDAEHNGWLERFFIRHRGAGALHRKRTVHSIDYAAELDDGTIAHQLDDAAVVGGDGRVEDGLSVPLQGGQRTRLVGSHHA